MADIFDFPRIACLIPRTPRGVVPEAAILDQLCTAYFPTVRLPVKEESEQVEELALFEHDGDD